MNSVTIVGVGLIGGSFALALRAAGFAGEILGVGRDETLETARQCGAITRGVSLRDALLSTDVLYLAQPIQQILLTLDQIGPLLERDVLVTDAGSTKQEIDAKAAECLAGGCFLGGHPMAGSEKRGVENASAELFRGRPYVLTPPQRQSRHLVAFRSWITAIGAEIVELSPARHDEAVALSSHLPQLISTTLAATLQSAGNPDVERVFGPGLLDMTRLALSSPEVWLSVLETNKGAVRAGLEAFSQTVAQMQAALDSGDLSAAFGEASVFARRIRSL